MYRWKTILVCVQKTMCTRESMSEVLVTYTFVYVALLQTCTMNDMVLFTIKFSTIKKLNIVGTICHWPQKEPFYNIISKDF